MGSVDATATSTGLVNPISPNDASFTTSGGGSPSGLALDLTLVIQATTGITAYRERVVPGGDDGSLQTFEPDGAGNTANVGTNITLERYASLQLTELRRVKALLKMMLAAIDKKTTPDDDDLDMMEDYANDH